MRAIALLSTALLIMATASPHATATRQQCRNYVRANRKKARMSSARSSGCSAAAK